MANKKNIEEAFTALGFNSLEAEVYIALLKNGPQTAYRIGKLLNKPTANVYKAVDVLSTKGAIIVDESDIRICKALPIKSVAEQLERDYKNKVAQATEILSTVQKESNEEGIFKLQSTEAVIQKAKEMLRNCEKVMVIDAFPAPLKLILKEIQKNTEKKREIYLQAYEEMKMEGVSLSIPETGVREKTLKYWKAQKLNLVVDGKEMLVALFNHDMSELIQATYSNNLYLSCNLHEGMMSEHNVHLFSQARSIEEVQALAAKQKFFFNSSVPGLGLLFKQYKKRNNTENNINYENLFFSNQ